MEVVKDELSAISEDENEMANESEVYERKKYPPSLHAPRNNILRDGLNKDGFKNLMEMDTYSVENSALDKNISSKGSRSLYQGALNTKMLPSSLLK